MDRRRAEGDPEPLHERIVGSHSSLGSAEKGRKLVKMTWAYKVKRNGTLKARLCVQGCTQVAGIDYNQTFCSTMRGSTLRSVCAAAAQWGLHMRRWDFVAAYLQGRLDEGETVYCSLPPGYPGETTADGQPAIYRIKKPVTGWRKPDDDGSAPSSRG